MMKTLKDITVKIGSGSTPQGGKSNYKESGISLIRSMNVYDFHFTINGLAFIDENQAKKLSNVEVEEGDILFNITGDSINRTCIVPKQILPARVNQHVSIIRCKKGIDSRYVNYYLINLKSYLNQICGVGGTRNALTKEALEKIQIRIPENQKQIAKVLSDIDSKIELNNKINAELETMAKLIYDYWFVQFDFPISETQAQEMNRPDLIGKPYKSSGGKMSYNPQLKREIPEGWEVETLSEIAVTGSGGTPLKNKNEYYEDGTIPWINSGEVNAPFITKANKFITDEGLNNSSAKIFKKGTILMAMYGATAGKVSLMDIEATTNQAICAINPKKEFYTFFLKFALEDLYLYLTNLSSGSARDNLSQDKIKALNFVIAPDEILLKYHTSVNSSLNNILLKMKENEKLSILRDWLLPMLMNGQVIC